MKQNTYMLYALSENENRPYMETLLLSECSKAQIDKVVPLATRDGFHSFRVCTIDMQTVPDFIGSIN